MTPMWPHKLWIACVYVYIIDSICSYLYVKADIIRGNTDMIKDWIYFIQAKKPHSFRLQWNMTSSTPLDYGNKLSAQMIQ